MDAQLAELFLDYIDAKIDEHLDEFDHNRSEIMSYEATERKRKIRDKLWARIRDLEKGYK